MFWTGEGWCFFFGPVRVTQIVVCVCDLTGAAVSCRELTRERERDRELTRESERQTALSEVCVGERQTDTEGTFISLICRLYKLIKLSNKL